MSEEEKPSFFWDTIAGDLEEAKQRAYKKWVDYPDFRKMQVNNIYKFNKIKRLYD